MLELKNIRKIYKTGEFEQHALKGVNLDFRKNEFVAILGPSGSGKTTLLNIIGGLDRYTSGDLIINGKSTKEFKDRDWDAYRNNSIGFIFQNYNLITHISVLENVEMCMTLSGVSVSEKKKRALEVLEKVGLKDHKHKKPNQLSGGQMQRVAIARALVNNPDIILADEPTGALDTVTSVQIMQLIKEIAKDKLVIMVTHNPELAEKYATRIVKFKDGNIESDSNPPTSQEKEEKQEYNPKKTAMGFFTALKLSFTNIRTKKGRTILTAFASSIGIIGIAVILSLSNGFDKHINNFEADTLSSFPIIISQQAMKLDINEMIEQKNEIMNENKVENKYPDTQMVYPYNSEEKTIMHTNAIDENYIEYIEKMNKDGLMGISYARLTGINLLNKVDDIVKQVKAESINFSSLPEEIESNGSYLENGYDLLIGSMPKNKTELVVEVDNKNRIEKELLEILGIEADKEEIELSAFIGKELKIVLNNQYYEQIGKNYTINTDLDNLYENENNITLKIVGVVRAKEDNKLSQMTSRLGSTSSSSSPTIGNILYSDELIKEIININKQSDIVKKQMESEYNVITGEKFQSDSEKNNILNYLGAKDVPAMISIYPKDFSDKEEITNYLDKYNEDKEEKDKIIYTDMAEEFSLISGRIMDAITVVLIAFSSISLVVSTIMIAIITYISVLERTKEIGILRALGARKKDITRVFNAETFIVGLCSGAIGILITCLLLPGINSILLEITDLEKVASLNPIHAFILLAISVGLTLIGGWIPAKMAAKKDPVEALRTE